MKEAIVQNMNMSKVPDTTQLGHCSTDLQYPRMHTRGVWTKTEQKLQALI